MIPHERSESGSGIKGDFDYLLLTYLTTAFAVKHNVNQAQYSKYDRGRNMMPGESTRMDVRFRKPDDNHK
jgi:hypothetical protein